MMSNYKHAIVLFKNARQFVESAVSHARTHNQDDCRYAILHATIAIELLAKSRLAFEDPQLIAIESVDPQRFEHGNLQSINIADAFRRLTKITRFCLSSRHRAALKRLTDARNRLIHFRFIATEKETQALVASGLDIFFEIHEREFAEEEDPYRAKSMTTLAQDLSEFREFVSCRTETIAERLRTFERPRTLHFSECGGCLQEADVLVDDTLICLFCGEKRAIRDCAEMLGADRSVEKCPVCHRSSVAKYQMGMGEEPTYECFCCGYFRGPEIEWSDGRGSALPRLRAIDSRTRRSTNR